MVGHEEKPEQPSCQEDAYDEKIPELLRDLVGLPLSIIQLSPYASKVAWSLPSSSRSIWSLPPGIHVFVGVNASSSLPDSLVTTLNRVFRSPLFPLPLVPTGDANGGDAHGSAPSSLEPFTLFAPVPKPLFHALADVVLPTGHLGSLSWYHSPAGVEGGIGEVASLESYGYLPDPYTPQGLRTVPLGYRIALEQSSALGLSRVQLLSCTAPNGQDEAAAAAAAAAANPTDPLPTTTTLSASLGFAAEADGDDDAAIGGFHRTLTLSEVQVSGLPTASVCSLALLHHLPSGAYVDVYDLADRHDFRVKTPPMGRHPASTPRPRLLVHSPLAIDMEAPAFTSPQRAIGIVLDGLVTSSRAQVGGGGGGGGGGGRGGMLEVSSLSLPVHLRYPAPSWNRSRAYSHVLLSPPLVFVQCPDDYDGEWVLAPAAAPPPPPVTRAVRLRVPAGEAWLGDVVVVVTALFSIFGVVALGHAMYRLLTQGPPQQQQQQEEEQEGQQSASSKERAAAEGEASASSVSHDNSIEEVAEQGKGGRMLRKRGPRTLAAAK